MIKIQQIIPMVFLCCFLVSCEKKVVEKKVSLFDDPSVVKEICPMGKTCQLIEKKKLVNPHLKDGMVLYKISYSDHNEDLYHCAKEFKERGCPYEYWYAYEKNGKVFKQKIIADVNDGFGAAGVGDESFEIEGNVFEKSRSGGSAWRWSKTELVQLYPPKLLTENLTGFWTLGSNVEERVWDWEHLHGKSLWYSPECGATPEEMNEDEMAINDIDLAKYETLLFPRVKLSLGFRDELWKNASLTGCSAQMGYDGGDFSGYVEASKNFPKERTPSVKINSVLSYENELFIEIVGEPKDKEKASELLHLWTLDESPSYYAHCIDDKWEKQIKEWVFSVKDHKRIKGSKDLQYDAWTTNQNNVTRTVFKIQIPFKNEKYNLEPGIRFAYTVRYKEDKQKISLMSGTKTKKGDMRFGFIRPSKISLKRATCKIENGALQKKALIGLKPNEAILTNYFDEFDAQGD